MEGYEQSYAQMNKCEINAGNGLSPKRVTEIPRELDGLDQRLVALEEVSKRLCAMLESAVRHEPEPGCATEEGDRSGCETAIGGRIRNAGDRVYGTYELLNDLCRRLEL